MGRGADDEIFGLARKSKINETKEIDQDVWRKIIQQTEDPGERKKGLPAISLGEEEEAVSFIWKDIGPVKNPKNIIGKHKASAVWLGEIGEEKVIVKLPGARITKKGDLLLSSHSAVFDGHGTTANRSFEAELLVEDLLSRLGPEWSSRFAKLSELIPEEGFLAGQRLLLIEYLEGESLTARYRRSHPEPESSSFLDTEEMREYRIKARENFWSDDAEERLRFAEDARRILLIDLITMNSDRHHGNLSVSQGRLRAYDQGMAFGSDYQQRMDPIETAVLAYGGSDLRADERSMLESVLASDWLVQVEEKMGRESAAKIRARIDWMLEHDKLYSEKTRIK